MNENKLKATKEKFMNKRKVKVKKKVGMLKKRFLDKNKMTTTKILLRGSPHQSASKNRFFCCCFNR